jgi:alkylated DNA repair dioxygenase AlkB
MKEQLGKGWIEYYPDFVDQEESLQLFERILSETNWSQGKIKLFGQTHLTPRLEAFYAEDGKSYGYSGQHLSTLALTPILLDLKQKIELTCDHQFNSVLINLYRDGSDSNGWHADNEPELGLNPIIASLSLGAPRNFDLKRNSDQFKKRLLLESGSLLIMGGELQYHWKHAVAKSKKVKEPRINLTFRRII